MSDSTSQPSSRAAKSGKFALLSRAIKHSDFIFKFFPYRVVNLLNISSVFTELKAFLPKISKDSKLISLSLARWRFATNFDFCNAKFHWFVRYQMRVLIG